MSNHYKVHQAIVMRNDLKDIWKRFPGKLSAMAAHCSLGALLKSLDMSWNEFDEYGEKLIRVEDGEKLDRYEYFGDVTYPVYDWIKGDFAKIVLKVESLEALLEIQKAAEDAGLVVSKIIDNGTTVWGGEKTIVGLGIGPDISEKISPITKDLKLL